MEVPKKVFPFAVFSARDVFAKTVGFGKQQEGHDK
jgi:hypothetical protein